MKPKGLAFSLIVMALAIGIPGARTNHPSSPCRGYRYSLLTGALGLSRPAIRGGLS